MSAPVAFRALPGLPEVEPGADLSQLICEALRAAAIELQSGDVLVIAQKIVSKAEGRQRRLADVAPSTAAVELASTVRKDPRFVQLVLEESSAVVRAVPDILITRHRSGFVMANAGIDRSNLPHAEDTVLLLPLDCDASAHALRAAFAPLEIGVIVSDSFGRPWRQGTVNVALGVAGFPAVLDQRGTTDRQGRVMQTTQIALADAVAAGAGLVMGETSQGTPVVHVRGLDFSAPLTDGQSLVRPPAEDLFR